jgi:hypothetical protein
MECKGEEMSKFTKDLTNTKINLLTPIRFEYRHRHNLSSNSNMAWWLCKCDCGNEKWVRAAELLNGHTKSCGCYQKKFNKKDFGVSAFTNLYNKYKCSARYRNLEFNLSKEEFTSLTKQKCYYCGIEPKQSIETVCKNGNYIFNGVDRIDNSKGYTLDNCVPCCGICNKAKRDMTYNEFIEWIDRIIKNRRFLS